MKDIYYLTSTGERIELIGSPYRMLTETELFNYKWSSITQGENYPTIITNKKDMVEAPFSIRVIGSNRDDLLEKVEALIGAFDGDVYRNEMGRLYVGDYYRPCFITGATMGKVFEKSSTTIQFNATSDRADWVQWQYTEFEGIGSSYEGSILNDATFRASNNSSSLVVEPKLDNTVDLSWTNAQASGYLIIDLGEVKDVTSINGLVFPHSASLAYSIIAIEISNDALAWTSLDSIVQEDMYGEDIEWDYNTPETFRYLRIKNTGSTPIFTVQGNVGVYSTFSADTEELLTEDNLTFEGFKSVSWNGYRLHLEFNNTSERGYIYVNRIKNLQSLNIQTIAQTEYIGVTYKTDESSSWTSLVAGVGSVSWSGMIEPYILKIEIGNATSIDIDTSNHFSAIGVKRQYVLNDSYAPSEAIIRIYGETTNPYVTINGVTYGAEVEVEDGEYLEIDTFNRTCRIYDEEEGLVENVFAMRSVDTFTQIPNGDSEVVWFGDLKIEIEIEKGRSQPKWN